MFDDDGQKLEVEVSSRRPKVWTEDEDRDICEPGPIDSDLAVWSEAADEETKGCRLESVVKGEPLATWLGAKMVVLAINLNINN